MLAHEFMRHAFLAGTFIALACGMVGHFVVMRAQVFAGDALSHVAFTGALAAAAAGVDARIGLFAATVTAAAALGVLGARARADDVVIGSMFAWVLGLGVLFLSLFASGAGGADGTQAARVLFGSIFGLSGSEARLATAIAVAVIVVMLTLARPLLFASIDPRVAEAQGLPVRALGIAFLLALGVVAGEATQAVGALLLLGLLAAPAGAARLVTADPWKGLALSAAFATGSMWAGLTLSYQIPRLPPSTAVILVAGGAYLAAAILRPRLIRSGDARTRHTFSGYERGGRSRAPREAAGRREGTR
jgi:zinc/manganese transport system permease protein